MRRVDRIRALNWRFVLANTLIVRDIERSVAFYRDVVGATA